MKQLLLLFASLLFAGTAYAQLGVRVGANYASLITKTDEYNRASANGRVGYAVGVFYEKSLNTCFSVLPEVQFSHQRTYLNVEDYSIADGGYEGHYELTLDYLNVPVLLRATRGRFYFEAGPQAGILQAAHETGTEFIGSIAGTYQREFDRSATDSYRRFDVGIVAGVGLKLTAGFGVGLRASTGLLSITRLPHSVSYSGSLKNQAVQASVSYQLRSN